MIPVPQLFVAAADWVTARPLGCPTAAALVSVLMALTGPPRVGVCTLAGPVSGVKVCWPLAGLGASVDIVVVIHDDGPLALARPGVIVRQVSSPNQVQEATQITKSQLIDARLIQLAGEILALAAHEPALAPVAQLAVAQRPIVPLSPTVVVFGPDATEVSQTVRRLERAGVRCQERAPVGVAVAPPAGWTRKDAATLADAAARTRRLVSTAPLPAGVRGEVVTPTALPAAVRAGTPVPGAVQLAVSQEARRRAARRLQARLAQASSRAELVAVALDYGLRPPRRRRPALLPGVVAAVGLGVSTGALWFGGLIGGLVVMWRWQVDREEWVRREARRLREEYDRLDITTQSRVPALAGAAWLRSRASRG